jgi:hypothetical protein
MFDHSADLSDLHRCVCQQARNPPVPVLQRHASSFMFRRLIKAGAGGTGLFGPFVHHFVAVPLPKCEEGIQ